jgi:hypothetical protein
MRILGRLGAMILGLIGVVVGIIVDLIGVVNGHVNDLATHGVRGVLLVIAGLIGSLIVVFAPIVAAILLAIAGIGFFFVVNPLGAILVALPFVLAALLAYADRRPAKE